MYINYYDVISIIISVLIVSATIMLILSISLIIKSRYEKEIEAICEIKNILRRKGIELDEDQDILYSRYDNWQEHFSFMQYYDELAVNYGMVLYSEPIKFSYEDRNYMVGLWKGQYGFSAGAEISFYVENERGSEIYKRVDYNDFLDMRITVFKNDKILFSRSGKHWQVDGYKLGEFIYPKDLSINIFIEFQSLDMKNSFVQQLINLGYCSDSIITDNRAVSFVFDEPHNRQTVCLNAYIAKIAQSKNEMYCKQYKIITDQIINPLDKLKLLHDKSPSLFYKALKVGKAIELFYPIKN